MLSNFFISFLLSISQFLGVESLPNGYSVWKVDKKWEKSENGYSLQSLASYESIGCGPNEELILPQVVHGVHQIFSGNKLVYKSGDESYHQMTPFYKRGFLSCDLLSPKQEIRWTVTTYSRYFSRILEYPSVVQSSAKFFFFDVLSTVLATGCLLILCFLTGYLFFGKIERSQIISLIVGCLGFCFYSLFSSAGYFGIAISMIYAHKIADLALWTGFLSYLYFFRKHNLVGKLEFRMFIGAFLVGQGIILISYQPDLIQLGTTVPMPFSFICLMSILVRETIKAKNSKWTVDTALASISVLCFVVVGCNDLFHIFGLINSYMLIPLGSVFGVFFLAAAVNQDIEKTYIERDDLVRNLKQKVAAQTEHLSSALDQVNKSQADLVQSARLASLGTLSAGIAHEINNAINYVNGAVVPLERKVMKSIPEADRVITEKLFAAIKEGTHLTVEIVRSLRNFTGLNQAKVKDVNLIETVTSVLTILKSKIGKNKIALDIDESLVLNCYQVGLNQILMNLISNAIDVLPESNGLISISAKLLISSDKIEFRIADNGHGMSAEVKNRIFDAFFTTKEVGKGTGLGLHIVQKEVERHHGTIRVESEVNKGTTFVITIPKNLEMNMIREAS